MEPFRTTDPRFVDLLINHPDMRARMAAAGAERLSSEDLVRDRRNVVLAFEGGLGVFVWLAPGVYEAHVGALDCHRGKGAATFARAALAAMLTTYGAVRIQARAPTRLREVRYFARMVGFTGLGVDPSDEYEHFVMEAA